MSLLVRVIPVLRQQHFQSRAVFYWTRLVSAELQPSSATTPNCVWTVPLQHSEQGEGSSALSSRTNKRTVIYYHPLKYGRIYKLRHLYCTLICRTYIQTPDWINGPQRKNKYQRHSPFVLNIGYLQKRTIQLIKPLIFLIQTTHFNAFQ